MDGIVEFGDLLSVLSNFGRCWSFEACNELTGFFFEVVSACHIAFDH